MATRQASIYQGTFEAGSFHDTADYLIPETGLKELTDGFLEESGAAIERGGTVNKSNEPFNGVATGHENLATNPRGSVNTVGWIQDGALTFTRTGTLPTTDGLPDGVTTAFRINGTGADRARLLFDVEAGKHYFFSVYVHVVAGTPIITAGQNEGTGADLCGGGTPVNVNAEFVRIVQDFVAPATETAGIEIIAQAQPNDFYWTAVLIEEAPLHDYFDGDVVGAGWQGAAHNSISALLVGDGLRWIWDGYFDAGQRTVFADAADFGVLDADDETPIDLGGSGMSAPAPSAYVPDDGGAGLLFIGGGYIYGGARQAAYSAGTVDVTEDDTTVVGTGTAFLANVDPGMLFQHGSERVYVVLSVTDNTHLELSEPYEGATDTGEAYTLSGVYEITAADPYPDAAAYGVCANRLIWGEKNLVHASEPLRPHDLTATIGAEQIPTTHELPEGVRYTGSGTVGQTLIVFTTHGAWTIDGLVFDIADPSGNPQHRLQRHSGEVILWDANGIASWEQSLVVPCTDGIFLLNGVSQPLRISHPQDERIMDYVERGFKLGQAGVDRGHYLLPVYSGLTTMRDSLVCRINRPISSRGQTLHPWSRFDRHARDLIAYALRVGEATREPVLLGASVASDARIVECPFFDPDASNATDANGEVPTLDQISRAYPTGGDTENMVRNVRSRYELVAADPDAPPEIEFSYSLGREVTGLPTYNGEYQYDGSIQYGDVDEAAGFVSACVGGPSNGRTPKRCPVNKKTRFILWRVRNPDPSASCRVRAFDVRVRPSAAVRR